MGKLTVKNVEKTTRLASLDLIVEEIKVFTPQLASVIEYFDLLSEVDTEGITPTSQTAGLTNKLRNDEMKAERVLTISDVLSSTLKKHNNYFVVPQLIDKDNL